MGFGGRKDRLRLPTYNASGSILTEAGAIARN